MVMNKNTYENNTIYGTIGDIDCISRSESENERILTEAEDRVKVIYIENSTLDVVDSYKEFLINIKQTIEKQLGYIENISRKKGRSGRKDLLSTIWSFKKELSRKCCALYAMNYIEMLENDTGYTLPNMYIYSQVYYILQHTNKEIINFQNVENGAVLPGWKELFFLMLTERRNRKNFEQLPLNINMAESNSSYLAEKPGTSYVNLFQSYLARAVFYQRKRMHLTQKELSLISGVARSSIAKIESCKQSASLGATARILSTLHMGITIYPLENERNSKERGVTLSIMKNQEVS